MTFRNERPVGDISLLFKVFALLLANRHPDIQEVFQFQLRDGIPDSTSL
jgi:hypothetical protein